jgi:1-deoxyxylulose-5-phosphate synthase
MEYRRSGNSGLQVSVIGLGTNNFGPRMDYPTAERVLRQAVDTGINFVETPNTYGEGQAETFIGKALRGNRTQILVATKVASNIGDGPNMHGASRKHIMDQVDLSLQRLQTDYLDLYQIHYYDSFTPMEETLHTMDTLVQSQRADTFAVYLIRVPYDIELAIQQAAEEHMPELTPYANELRTAQYRGTAAGSQAS